MHFAAGKQLFAIVAGIVGYFWLFCANLLLLLDISFPQWFLQELRLLVVMEQVPVSGLLVFTIGKCTYYGCIGGSGWHGRDVIGWGCPSLGQLGLGIFFLSRSTFGICKTKPNSILFWNKSLVSARNDVQVTFLTECSHTACDSLDLPSITFLHLWTKEIA